MFFPRDIDISRGDYKNNCSLHSETLTVTTRRFQSEPAKPQAPPTGMGPVPHGEQLVVGALMAISLASCSVGSDRLLSPTVRTDLETDPGHFVVVTVRNEPAMLPASPGSSSRNYLGGSYTVASSAKRTADGLGRDYGLRQATAWLIPTMRLYCVVFQLPTSQESADVIARLEHDPRVNSAQPLNEFQTQSNEHRPSSVDCR
jgi:hypothetical protein